MTKPRKERTHSPSFLRLIRGEARMSNVEGMIK
jgi:hypothetical protein